MENDEMNQEIFRQKSLDKVKSPENLNDYIQVSNPSVWLLLFSILILLAGICVWGIFGRIDSIVETSVYVENGTAVCYVADEAIASVRPGMVVKLPNAEAVITEIGQREAAGCVCLLQSEQVIADGRYEGSIVTDSIRPLSFVLN